MGGRSAGPAADGLLSLGTALSSASLSSPAPIQLTGRMLIILCSLHIVDLYLFVRVCTCVFVYMRVCVRLCVRVCVRACVCVSVVSHLHPVQLSGDRGYPDQ